MKHLIFSIISFIALALNLLKGCIGALEETLQQVQGERRKKCGSSNQSNLWHTIIILCSLASFSISLGKTDPKLMLFNATDIDHNTKEITITFTVPEKDFIYKDFITCSIDQPMICLSPWKTDKQTISHYDPSFKETKQIFNETFSITTTATTKEEYRSEPIHLYCSYYRKADKKINDALFTFSFSQQLQTNIQIYDTAIEPLENITHNHLITKQRPFKSIDTLYYIFITQVHDLLTCFIDHHIDFFSLLFIIMTLLFLLFYFYHDLLIHHTKVYELLEVIFFLCISTTMLYTLWHVYQMNKPIGKLLATSMSVLFLMVTGSFYIKKSTNISLGFIRTLYNFMGMVSIMVMILLMFKTIQYADQHYNLFV